MSTAKKDSLAKRNGHAEPVLTLAPKAPGKVTPLVNEPVEEVAMVGVVITDESSTPGEHIVIATATTADYIFFHASGCVSDLDPNLCSNFEGCPSTLIPCQPCVNLTSSNIPPLQKLLLKKSRGKTRMSRQRRRGRRKNLFPSVRLPKPRLIWSQKFRQQRPWYPKLEKTR